MGNLLDKFESLILTYARRVVTFFIFLTIAVAVITFLNATLNYLDSPSKEMSDSFEIPEFSEPEEPKVSANESPETVKKSTNSQTGSTPKWQHPIPEYEDELSDIIEEIKPLYVAVSLTLSDEGLIDYIAATIANTCVSMTESQKDDVVDGLVDYTEDLSSYYRDKFDIPTNLKKIKKIDNPEFNGFLLRVEWITPYFAEVRRNYGELVDEVELSEQEAQANNMSAAGTIFVTIGALGFGIVLILILLLFKAENSMRRQAEALEKN